MVNRIYTPLILFSFETPVKLQKALLFKIYTDRKNRRAGNRGKKKQKEKKEARKHAVTGESREKKTIYTTESTKG
jgi:hypothetical protein